jgi:hypothetical protein
MKSVGRKFESGDAASLSPEQACKHLYCLLASGCKPSARCSNTTALHLAIGIPHTGVSESLSEVLVAAGANPAVIGCSGMNAIEYAISVNKRDLAEHLMHFMRPA